jgi:hypothetical protein
MEAAKLLTGIVGRPTPLQLASLLVAATLAFALTAATPWLETLGPLKKNLQMSGFRHADGRFKIMM